MKFKIYVITHKEFDTKLPENYVPILVGSYKNNISLYQRDDEGDFQISKKNSNYCELTGLYWIWKNTNEEYVGLCHYRRYFINKKGDIINDSELANIINKCDIILPKRWYYFKDIYTNYKESHYIKDLDLCKKIIEEDYPEFLDSYNKVMKRNYIFLYNMFICKKSLIDEYCEWLFSIFDKLEKQIDISEYDDYQKRIFGFLSERLFNVWIEYKNLNIKELDVVKIGLKRYKVILSKMKNKIKKIYGIIKK